MPTKKEGRGNYRLFKAELGNMIIHRKTLDDIAERFGISWTSAKNWRNKYYNEEGTLTPEMKEEMLKEFIVDTRKETELQKIAMLKVLTAPEDQGKAIGASNSITGIHKKDLDRLRGIDVLMPEKKIIEGGMEPIRINIIQPKEEEESETKQEEATDSQVDGESEDTDKIS